VEKSVLRKAIRDTMGEHDVLDRDLEEDLVQAIFEAAESGDVVDDEAEEEAAKERDEEGA